MDDYKVCEYCRTEIFRGNNYHEMKEGKYFKTFCSENCVKDYLYHKEVVNVEERYYPTIEEEGEE